MHSKCALVRAPGRCTLVEPWPERKSPSPEHSEGQFHRREGASNLFGTVGYSWVRAHRTRGTVPKCCRSHARQLAMNRWFAQKPVGSRQSAEFACPNLCIKLAHNQLFVGTSHIAIILFLWGWTSRSALVVNSLCPGQEKHTMHKREV